MSGIEIGDLKMLSGKEPKVILNLKPVRPIENGDVFEFLYDMETRSNLVHWRGSTIEVVGLTSETPFGEISARGFNWICKTEHDVSVWATLEQCLSRGVLLRHPRFGETIQVPPSWYIESKFDGTEYVDAFSGGPATVQRVFRAHNITWVEIVERPGHGYNWHHLGSKQNTPFY